MFIQHKQLKNLNIPAGKVVHLHFAPSQVQLAFAGYPPQLSQAYLLQILGGNKVLVVVAFYLSESQSSIFFVPKSGEVSISSADSVYEEGSDFIESMGFVLIETDYHLLSEQEKTLYWSDLPICKLITKEKPKVDIKLNKDDELKKFRIRSLKSIGRFLASM